MLNISGFGYYDAETLLKEADTYNKFVEEMDEKFNILKEEDKDEFRLYILDTLKKLAAMGCSSFEYQTDTNLEQDYSEFLNMLKEYGFKYIFYNLNEEIDDKKYNLIIDWGER